MHRTTRPVLAIAALVAAGTIGGIVASTTGGAGAATPMPAGIVILNPTRVLDTRNTGKLGIGGVVTVSTGITGAIAVAVNITLVDTEAAGYVTAWDGVAPQPNTSIINSDGPGQTVANYAIVPVDPSGRFVLYTSARANLLVDYMGYLPTPSTTATTLPPTGFTVSAVITGYSPGSSFTQVTGTVTNVGSTTNARVDIRCPNGTVETDSFFTLGTETKGFSVLCGGGAFTTGATVQAVVKI